MGKSKEVSINLKKCVTDLSMSGNSLGDISKQLQDQLCKQVSIKCISQFHATVRNKTQSPAAERKLVRMVKSQLKTTEKEVIQYGALLNQLGGCQVQVPQ